MSELIVENNNQSLTEINNNTSQVSNDTPMQMQIYFHKIGGSNNSQIFELFGYYPEQYPRKNIPLNKVMKQISHSGCGNSKLKIHRKECQHLQNEVNMLSELNHDNIIKVCEHVQGHSSFCGLVLPKADCDLFQLLKNSPNGVDIRNIKGLFKQLASALVYLHEEKKISHNDIKPANLFIMVNQAKMILADFGFASKHNIEQEKQNQQTESQNQYQKWYTRANRYMSPELLKQRQEQNKDQVVLDQFACDMFAFGVTLFEAVFLISPFSLNCADPQDALFGNFYRGDIMAFWQNKQLVPRLNHYKNLPGSNLSCLLDLLTRCFCVDPAQRITASQTLNHPWFTTDVTNQQQSQQSQM